MTRERMILTLFGCGSEPPSPSHRPTSASHGHRARTSTRRPGSHAIERTLLRPIVVPSQVMDPGDGGPSAAVRAAGPWRSGVADRDGGGGRRHALRHPSRRFRSPSTSRACAQPATLPDISRTPPGHFPAAPIDGRGSLTPPSLSGVFAVRLPRPCLRGSPAFGDIYFFFLCPKIIFLEKKERKKRTTQGRDGRNSFSRYWH